MALLIFVDDAILAVDNFHDIAIFKSYLYQSFALTDLGELKFFLGIEVARSSKGITLCQKKYAIDILTENGFCRCKPTTFPMESNLKLNNHDPSSLLTDPASYRRLVGPLLYLTII